MAYQKLKKESYSNVGGINTKASVYITGENDVLDLQNYDFSTPGAWSKRPGYTTALTGNTYSPGSSLINQMFQVVDAEGGNQQQYLVTNNKILGFTNGLMSLGMTLIGNSRFYSAAVTSYGNGNNVQLDKVTFFTDGNENIYKAVRSATVNSVGYFGVPDQWSFWGQTFTSGGSYWPDGLFYDGGGSPGGFATGSYDYQFTFSDILGKESHGLSTLGSAPENTYKISTGNVLSPPREALRIGVTFSPDSYEKLGRFLPDAVNIYRNRIPGKTDSEMWYVGSVKWATLVAGFSLSQAYLFVDGGFTATFLPTDLRPLEYRFQQTTAVEARNYANFINVEGFSYIVPRARALATYSGRLIILSPDKKIWFSEAAETNADFEDIAEENFIVSNINGFPLNCATEFQGSCIIFSQKGVERLTGDGPSSFFLQTITTEYGAVSPRASVQFKDTLFFVDEAGIIEYNGANVQKVSDRVEKYMKSMNLSVAFENVTAVHWEDRNELWFAIPTNSSNVNDLIIVYNYLINAWTTFKTNANPTMLSLLYRTFSRLGSQSATSFSDKRMFLGTTGCSLMYFGTEFKSDNGSAITLSFETRNHTQGKSITQQWRRFYLDNGPWAGVTLPFNVQMYSDFATLTPAYTTTMFFSGSEYSGDQQTRVDFGIPSKAWRAKVVHGSTTGDVSIYGFTVESRFQRNV